MASRSDPSTSTVRAELRAWFFAPPRRHGEVLEDRAVGRLELFYDLVFVVFVGQLAHHLAEHVTPRGLVDFVVLFSVMWVTWFNGSIYHELHGNEDGRARGLMFGQMLLLAVLATQAADAGGESGQAFATTMALLLALQTFQWWTVYRLDEEHFQRLAGRYLIGSVLAIGCAVGAALADTPEARLAIWVLFLVIALGGTSVLLGRTPRESSGLVTTESLVERFELFVIIVLGEVVVGVVTGLSEVPNSALVIATALLALAVSFGFWWTYFDAVGGRLPRASPGAVVAWLNGHLPLTCAIAAAGAGIVSLVEHAGDDHTPAATAWLLGGAVAMVLLMTAALDRVVEPKHAMGRDPRLALILGAGAVSALVVAALAPAPWLLVVALNAILATCWGVAFVRFLAAGARPSR